MNYLFVKRSFDFVFGLTAIIVLFPVFLIVGLLVLFYHNKPILFSQKRPGYQEKIFRMYKFRTMTNETDSSGNLLPDEIRLTKFGSFLRRTSLDELPELFNIFKGDMSLIGPRPLLVKYLPFYTERERKRHNVRPGLTGLSQVSGRNTLDWDKRLEKDVEYVENIGFLLDFKILIKTFTTVIKRENIGLNIIDDFDEYRKKKR